MGAGNFAEEVLDVVQESGSHDVVCFVEGIDRSRCGGTIAGIPVVWIDDVASYDTSHFLLCGVGSPKRKRLIDQAGSSGLKFANVLHPTARISRTVEMGHGIFASVGVILGAGCKIGNHVILNRAAVIGHHVDVADYVTISPGANIGGGAHIGEGAYIGMGAIILDHVSIGRHSVVGAGAVVTKDVPEDVQVLGVPARITKQLTKSV